MDSNSAMGSEHVHFRMAAKRSLALSQVMLNLKMALAGAPLALRTRPPCAGSKPSRSISRSIVGSPFPAFRQSTLQWIEPNSPEQQVSSKSRASLEPYLVTGLGRWQLSFSRFDALDQHRPPIYRQPITIEFRHGFRRLRLIFAIGSMIFAIPAGMQAAAPPKSAIEESGRHGCICYTNRRCLKWVSKGEACHSAGAVTALNRRKRGFVPSVSQRFWSR
jgi:hypothetical protein